MKKILFVCLGNICRSPLAEGIARELNSEFHFDSAGTGSWHIGEMPCDKSRKIAKKFNTSIDDLRARQVKYEDFAKFDLLVAMDRQNLADLEKMGAKNAVLLLGDRDVPDPYFLNGDEGMTEIYEMIKDGVEKILKD
jgi:protein-tyrosine phosphatase